MPRSPTGTIEARKLVDGTRVFHLRFFAQGRREFVVLHERSACVCGCGGGWSETAARTELGDIQARVRAGVWQHPSGVDRGPTAASGPPLFEAYARRWRLEKIEGSTGPKPISVHTANDYRWRLEQYIDPLATPDELGATTVCVAGLLAEDQRPKQIAARLGIAPSTVTYHLKVPGATPNRGYAVRRTVVEILGRSGLRATELCELRVGHVRLSGPNAARLTIVDAKSEAGIREVQMTPELTRVVTEHLVRLRRTGLPTGLGNYLIPNSRGGQLSRQRVARIVGEAAALASKQRAERCLSQLPHTTPHSLRRTYISIALLANQFDVKWVMHQVGHADSRMTLDVYAQLQRRIDRGHGASFDRLVRAARDYQRKGDEKATSGIDRTPTTNVNITLATS